MHYFNDGCAGQYKKLQKTSSTCVSMKRILALNVVGHFLLPVMGSRLVMVLVELLSA